MEKNPFDKADDLLSWHWSSSHQADSANEGHPSEVLCTWHLVISWKFSRLFFNSFFGGSIFFDFQVRFG